MPRVLVITYSFPPQGGPGVQRVLKWIKYLPDYGWSPLVVTITPPNSGVRDDSLLDDVPEDIPVYRVHAIDHLHIGLGISDQTVGFAKTKRERRRHQAAYALLKRLAEWLLVPDDRVGWFIPALIRARQILRANADITTILTSSGPETTNLIGAALKRKWPHLRWVADMRDLWVDDPHKHYPTRLHRAVNALMERKSLARADALTVVGPSMKQILAARAWVSGKPIFTVPNGFDEEDFVSVPTSSVRSSDRYVVGYVGSLYRHQLGVWRSFLTAVSRLCANGFPVTVRMVGRFTPEAIEDIPDGVDVVFTGYQDHRAAIQEMMAVQCLLLIVSGDTDARTMVTGKVFEYLASGTPILALVARDSDCARLVRASQAGYVLSSRDPDSIAVVLERILRHGPTNRSECCPQLSRRVLAGRLASVLYGHARPEDDEELGYSW